MRFYRCGEVVHDIGIIALNGLIDEMAEEGYDIKYKLASNGLEIDGFIEEDFFSYITKTKLNLSYFPYLRNSAKYGANAQSIDNFHRNFRQLISIVTIMNMKDNDKQVELLDKYKPVENECTVCHNNITTIYDISHKENTKERINSKYNYSFMGAENNLFNNYGKANSNICFECEFLNLMYLLYINVKQPSFIIYTDDLKLMEFLNYKMLLEFKNLNQKSFYNKLTKYMNKKMRIYRIVIDANKGIILNLCNVVEIDKLGGIIKYYDLIDNYNFSKDGLKRKEICKGYIISNNFISIEDILINNLLYIDEKDGRNLDKYKTLSNIRIYLEVLCMNKKGYDGVEENKIYTNGFEELGEELSIKISDDNKKAILFKINQMMKCEDRTGLFETMMHLIAVNECKIPKGFSYTIMKSTSNEMHYKIGKFMESFINHKEEK